MNQGFWSGKRVFLTGHTGFKGGWLAVWLKSLGARVTGYSLAASTNPSFFELCRVAEGLESVTGDVRDLDSLARTLRASRPEIVLHLAAQPLVRRSYQQPVETMASNIMGTVHLLEAARQSPGVRAILVITSDKCYRIRPTPEGYREEEPMGGRDPYSASKGCAELVSAAYQHSFFRDSGAAIATARAGNVIGGGDWSEDRLVPDAIRALASGAVLRVRNPHSVRPWQHVLEPLSGYLVLAERLFEDPAQWQGGWNFGPGDADAVPVSDLSDLLVHAWGDGARWQHTGEPRAPHEEPYLKLNSGKARQLLGWHPRLNIAEAVDWAVSWYRRAMDPASDMAGLSRAQIREYQQRMDSAQS